MKKGIDKGGGMWYNMQAVSESGSERERERRQSSLKIEQQDNNIWWKNQVYIETPKFFWRIKRYSKNK